MAERKVTSTLYLDGAPADEELNPFAIRIGPAAQRATGRKTTAKRKSDKPRDLKAREKAMKPMERQLYARYGLEPDIPRPGLLPLAVNPRSGDVELTAPQGVYDAVRAIEAPGMVLSGAPVDLEEEARNFGLTFTGAGLGTGLAARPVEGAVLTMSGGRRPAAAASGGAKKVSTIALEYGPNIASRLDGMIEPSAPLSVWRTAADRLAATESPNMPRLTRSKRLENAPYDPAEFEVKVRDKPATEATRGLYEEKSGVQQPPEINIQDLIGRPFITSMADRTAAMRRLLGVNNTMFDQPVELLGGQDFMFDPTTGGLVWASEPGVVTNLQNMARVLADKYGVDPLYIPFRMKGSGSDFSTMTGDTMMRYAAANLGKRDLARVNKALGESLPWTEKFAGIETPVGEQQYRDLPGKYRVDMARMLGDLVPEGGLTIGQTRLLIADPSQVDAPKFAVQNVGIIDPSRDPILGSGHPSFFGGLPGQGMGVLDAPDINVMELLPELAKRFRVERPDLFSGSPTKLTPEEAAVHGASRMDPGYLLRMSPQSGFIDEAVVEAILRRRRERGE